MTWRQQLAPMISAVLRLHRRESLRVRRRILRTTFEAKFGPRRGWPYSVWLDEIAIQIGKRKRGVRKKSGITTFSPDQMQLFEVK